MMNLIDFHRGDGTDSEGRTLDEILAWPDDDWEMSHDFIQWVFPTRKASRFNPDAPLPTDDDIRLFHADPLLRANLRRSFERFLNFLGLDYEGDRVILKERKRYAWGGPNHNWLRITRVLDCLTTLGLEQEAADLFACLTRLLADPAMGVDGETFRYWRRAGVAAGKEPRGR